MATKAEQAARVFDELIGDNRIIALPEALRPATAEEAYAIQDVSLRRDGAYGWKVGPGDVPEGLCASPLKGGHALPSPATLTYSQGFAVEIEIAVTLKNALPETASASDVEAALGSLHLAYELFQSRYEDRTTVGFLSVLADHINNAGIVVGAAAPAAAGLAFETMPVTLLRDGKEMAKTEKGMSRAETLNNIAWLARHAARRGVPLAAGTVILTGARIGPLDVAAGSTYRATSPLGSVELNVR